MFKHALTILAALLFVAAVDSEEESVKKDTQALQGAWSFTSLIVEGEDKVENGSLKNVALEFADGKLSFKSGEISLTLKYRIYPTTMPKGIDFTFTKASEEAKEGETLEGIYELDGDNLKFCVTPPGGSFKQRPTDFSAKEAGKILVVMQRAKN